MNDHKLYELTINENGIRFRHANPRPLSAEQKYHICMALIACVTVCIISLGFFSLLR